MTPNDERLIQEIVKNIHSEITHTNELIANKLEQILQQTTKTNGRVSRLETETTIGRWFERKPGRFVLILIFILVLTAEGVRSIVQSIAL